MISVLVETAALQNHRLLGSGLSVSKLARYLRHFVARQGVLAIYRVNPAPEIGEPAITVITLNDETSLSDCLMALAQLPNGGVLSRIVSHPPPPIRSRRRGDAAPLPVAPEIA